MDNRQSEKLTSALSSCKLKVMCQPCTSVHIFFSKNLSRPINIKKRNDSMVSLIYLISIPCSIRTSLIRITGTALWKTQLDQLKSTVLAINPDVETPEVGHQTGARRGLGVGTVTKINIWVKISSLY